MLIHHLASDRWVSNAMTNSRLLRAMRSCRRLKTLSKQTNKKLRRKQTKVEILFKCIRNAQTSKVYIHITLKPIKPRENTCQSAASQQEHKKILK